MHQFIEVLESQLDMERRQKLESFGLDLKSLSLEDLIQVAELANGERKRILNVISAEKEREKRMIDAVRQFAITALDQSFKEYKTTVTANLAGTDASPSLSVDYIVHIKAIDDE